MNYSFNAIKKRMLALSKKLNRKSDTPPRFTAGKLVMLSRKEVKSGQIPYFHDIDDDNTPEGDRRIMAGRLGRGVPILLIDDPKIVKDYYQSTLSTRMFKFLKRKNGKRGAWLIRFILDNKIYRMYLTIYQYNNELVRAVPRRLKKDYGTGY